MNKSPMLSEIEGKHVRITGRIEMYKGQQEIRISRPVCSISPSSSTLASLFSGLLIRLEIRPCSYFFGVKRSQDFFSGPS